MDCPTKNEGTMGDCEISGCGDIPILMMGVGGVQGLIFYPKSGLQNQDLK
jgi:hypothetical protein